MLREAAVAKRKVVAIRKVRIARIKKRTGPGVKIAIKLIRSGPKLKRNLEVVQGRKMIVKVRGARRRVEVRAAVEAELVTARSVPLPKNEGKRPAAPLQPSPSQLAN